MLFRQKPEVSYFVRDAAATSNGMYVVEVIPLTILPPNVPQILSYFFDPALQQPAASGNKNRSLSDGAGAELQRGAIVEVVINNRRVKAVVISSSPLEKEKLALKKVSFQLKKLTKVLYEDPQVSDYQLKIAAWLAKRYYAPLGYTLKTILPPFAFKKKFPLTLNTEVIHIPTSQVGYQQPQLLIYKTKRLVNYLEPLIKEVVSRSKQVLIVVPEKTTVDYFVKGLPGGVSSSVVFSGLPNEKQYDAWQRVRSGETSVVVGTRQALNMPFRDLRLIIVDDPLHEFYKSDMVPRYHAVVLAHKIAELNNSRLIITSVIPGVEIHHKAKNGIYELKNIEPSWRGTCAEPGLHRPKFDVEIVDMTQEVKNGNWSLISKKLNEELVAYLKSNKKVLIFSPRRGYAGILICGNCGSAAKCSQCEVAMRTHRSVEMILVCHHCGISKPMPKNCSVCGNYNLRTVGPAGTQKIYDDIKARLARQSFSSKKLGGLAAANIKSVVLALDTDIVKNEAEEEEIISEISKAKSAVLIATQMVFSHRFRLNFDLIAVINADALTNIPDFRSEENLFYKIKNLVNFEPEKMLIQTYNPENNLMEKAAAGDYVDFYDRELKLREALNYPPFFRLVKLTFRHKDKDKASYAARITTEKLKMAVARAKLGEAVKIIEAVPAYIEKEKGLYLYNIFLKVRNDYKDIGELPAVSLSNLLKYAGPGWIIDVEPRSLL